MNFIRSFFEYLNGPKPARIDPMKYLVVGLGNIGEEYDWTRHNAGFEAVDRLALKFEVKWNLDTLGFVSEFRHKSRSFYLLKPNTYMNLSGKSVRYWMTKLGIQKENVLVVVDDLALPFGSVRLRPNGNHAGHNGLKDIDRILGDNKYARLRIGIGNDFPKGGQVNYVLGKWSKKEMESIDEVLDQCCEIILTFGTIGLERAMNQFNKR